jgi:hypothetical protein
MHGRPNLGTFLSSLVDESRVKTFWIMPLTQRSIVMSKTSTCFSVSMGCRLCMLNACFQYFESCGCLDEIF